jgi:hypothetical protein
MLTENQQVCGVAAAMLSIAAAMLSIAAPLPSPVSRYRYRT